MECDEDAVVLKYAIGDHNLGNKNILAQGEGFPSYDDGNFWLDVDLEKFRDIVKELGFLHNMGHSFRYL